VTLILILVTKKLWHEDKTMVGAVIEAVEGDAVGVETIEGEIEAEIAVEWTMSK
jgi:hypothetical protein